MTVGATELSRYNAAARAPRAAPTSSRRRTCRRDRRISCRSAEAKLGPDKTTDGDMPLGDHDLGLRVIGAGEEMELIDAATAGTDLILEVRLEALAPSAARSGPCVFVTTSDTFMTGEGKALNRNRRTVVLRNPLQEAR